MYVDFNFFMKIKMKKTFWIMWTWLLLASNVLVSFSNVSFAFQNNDIETETDWCYVYADYVKPTKWAANSYLWTKLLAYKCDVEWWTVDLTKMPLEDGQYLVAVWSNAFSWTNVTKVIMPSTVESVWNWAFCNAEKVWTGCWNWIIEQWEECDDWSEWSYYCAPNCKKILCWNEDCYSCPEDVNSDGSCDFLFQKSLNDGQELEYKGEYIDTKAMAAPVDNTIFVVVDFSGWMNSQFNIDNLDYACAKLQEYIVTFETEDRIFLWTWETYYKHIDPLDIPDAPEKEWFIWTWYLWDEIFDFNSQITDNIRLVYKYEKGWVEYDEENWWIKVSLWDQEIIIKDKNQGAEKSVNEVDTGNSSDFINAIWTYYLWWNNTWLDSSEIFDENGQILDEVILPEWFDHGYLWLEWWDDRTMWSNDTPCNADSWEYMPSPEEWKNLMQLWWKLNEYGFANYNWMYSFEDSSVLYPNPITEGKSLKTFISADSGMGGSESYDQVSGNVQYSSAIKKFLNDLYISEYPSLYVENWWVDFGPVSILFPSSLNNWKVWYLTMNWLFVFEESNSEWFENNIATPVRCFIKPQFEVSFEVNGWTDVVTQKIFSWDNAVEPEVQKENAEFLWWFKEDGTIFKFDTPITSDIKLHAEWQEKKTNNGYSGWWGGGSSSSSSVKNSDKSDDPSKDKVSSVSEVKENSTSEEKVDKEQQNNLVDDNQKQTEKTETVVTHKVSYVPDTTLPEKEQAYDFAHTYWITTKTSVESAEMDKPLTRIQMSKMLSQYAMNVMWRQPDVSEWTVKFRDVTNDMDKSYDNWVTLSYQLWIMWQNMPNHKFRPNDIVTRAEFITALSRLLYSTSDGEYRSTSRYYVHHMEKLKNEWIITNDNPNMTEKRWYVMLMLLRSVK